jgi:uncharacterized protein YuzE
MKIEYNDKTDLLYIRLDLRAQELLNRRVAEIEIMNASRRLRLGELLPISTEGVG